MILKIIGIGLITAIAVIILKQFKPEIAMVVGLAGGVILIIYIANLLGTVIDTFTNITEKTGVDSELFTLLLKMVGVGYLTDFSASMIADTGSNAIADKVLVAGKIVIMIMALPIITTLIDIIASLMNL